MSSLSLALTRFIEMRDNIVLQQKELDETKKMWKELELSILCAMEGSGLEIVATTTHAFTAVKRVDEHGDPRTRLDIAELPSMEELKTIEVREI